MSQCRNNIVIKSEQCQTRNAVAGMLQEHWNYDTEMCEREHFSNVRTRTFRSFPSKNKVALQ